MEDDGIPSYARGWKKEEQEHLKRCLEDESKRFASFLRDLHEDALARVESEKELPLSIGEKDFEPVARNVGTIRLPRSANDINDRLLPVNMDDGDISKELAQLRKENRQKQKLIEELHSLFGPID